MVLDKGQHTRRVGIKVVIDKRVVDAVQPLIIVVGVLAGCLYHAVIESEVHNGGQM